MTVTISFIVILYSILDVLPLLFLKQAQNTVGESDFVYRAKAAENISQSADYFAYNYDRSSVRTEIPDNSSAFINYTYINEKVEGFGKYKGVAPRWFGVADFINPNKTDKETSGIVMVLDTKKEKDIGLGRDFTKELLGENQAFVIRSALRYLGLEANNQDMIRISIDLRTYFSLFLGTNEVLTIEDIERLVDAAGLNITRNQTIELSVNDFVNITQLDGKISS